jgi:transcriptional regulator GlxA family with amidase domain
VTAVAALYGFTHFGRFAAIYRRQFGLLPSVTFAGRVI